MSANPPNSSINPLAASLWPWQHQLPLPNLSALSVMPQPLNPALLQTPLPAHAMFLPPALLPPLPLTSFSALPSIHPGLLAQSHSLGLGLPLPLPLPMSAAAALAPAHLATPLMHTQFSGAAFPAALNAPVLAAPALSPLDASRSLHSPFIAVSAASVRGNLCSF